MTSIRFLVPTLALLFGATSLAATVPAPDNSVPIGGYTLISLSENGHTMTPGSAAPRPTISFDGRRVTGFSGCNSFGASYVARQNIARFGSLASTLRACPDLVDGLEEQYLKLLRGVTRFNISGAAGNQVLTLYSGSADTVVFMQNAGSGEVATLGIRSKYDGTWTLNRVPASLKLSSDTRPTQFTLKGSDVSGFDGCNQFSGKLNTSSGRLVFAGPVMSTKIFCPPQEANLVPLLTVGAAATVQGKTLTLTDANGGQWVLSKP